MPSLENLCEVESRIDLLRTARKRVCSFCRRGDWLIERDFLLSALLARWHLRGAGSPVAIPGLSDCGTPRLLGALASPTRYRSNARAVAVYFKSSVRAFYLDPAPITVKMSPRGASATGFESEVRARQNPGSMLERPRLIQFDLGSEPRFLCEELISGRRPDPRRDRQRIVNFVLGDLWRHYEAQNLDFVECGELYDVDEMLRDVAAASASISWDRNWLERSAFLRALQHLELEKTSFVPCCEGHGDLSEGNMLIANDGSIYVVDWERSRRQSFFREMKKIFVQYPDTWEPIVQRVTRCFTDHESKMVPPRWQAVLVALERILELQHPLPGSDTLDSGRRGFLAKKRGRLLAQEYAAASLLLRRGEH